MPDLTYIFDLFRVFKNVDYRKYLNLVFWNECIIILSQIYKGQMICLFF